jgi:transcriptional accessory protein Tex/SPT6
VAHRLTGTAACFDAMQATQAARVIQMNSGARSRAGERVKCKVIDVDAAKGRVALSLREMQTDPLKLNLQNVLSATENEVCRIRDARPHCVAVLVHSQGSFCTWLLLCLMC